MALGLISTWSCRSVSSPSERKVIAWFICKSWDCHTSYRSRLDFVSSVCTNPKRLSEGVLSSASPSSKLRILLPTMTSNLCCLSTQLRRYPPSITHCEEALRRGQEVPIAGLSLDKTRLFLTQLRFQPLRHLEGVIPHRFHVKTEIKRQKVLERIQAQPIGHQRGPLGLHIQQFRGHRLGEQR